MGGISHPFPFLNSPFTPPLLPKNPFSSPCMLSLWDQSLLFSVRLVLKHFILHPEDRVESKGKKYMDKIIINVYGNGQKWFTGYRDNLGIKGLFSLFVNRGW